MKDTNTDNARKVTINIVKANIFAIVLMVASAVVLIVPYCLIWGGKWKTGGVDCFFDSFFSNGVVFLVAMLVGVVVHELKAAAARPNTMFSQSRWSTTTVSRSTSCRSSRP